MQRISLRLPPAAELARRYPEAKVDPDVLYVDDDPVISSAGTAAGLDACLYLVRKEQGSRVANGITRRKDDCAPKSSNIES